MLEGWDYLMTHLIQCSWRKHCPMIQCTSDSRHFRHRSRCGGWCGATRTWAADRRRGSARLKTQENNTRFLAIYLSGIAHDGILIYIYKRDFMFWKVWSKTQTKFLDMIEFMMVHSNYCQGTCCRKTLLLASPSKPIQWNSELLAPSNCTKWHQPFDFTFKRTKKNT